MLIKFNRTSNTPCPICGSLSSGCKQVSENQKIFCRGDVSLTAYDHYTQISENGQWKIFLHNDLVVNPRKMTEEQRQKHYQELKRQEEERKEFLRKKTSKLIPGYQRDREIRQLLDEL